MSGSHRGERLTAGEAVVASQRRIRVFSVVVGVLLAAAAVVFGVLTLPEGSAGGQTQRVVTDDDYSSPWENPDPRAAELDDGVYSGAGQAVIRLDGLDPERPLLIEQLDEFEADSPYLDVSLTGPDAKPLPFSDRPVDVDLISAPYYAIPGAASIELWVGTYDDAPWRLRVTVDEDMETRGGTVSGVGSASFLYTGDATSARASARGSSTVRIEQVTAAGRADLFDSHEQRDRTIAWPDSPSSVFIVEAYGSETPWTIKFHESEQSETANGTETATEAPQEPASADEGDAAGGAAG
ncbi:hypothetical protein NHL51_11720 [Leucobacter sp. gxy201]|uniref:hypothetical protein n=1 Tax=Leucobacter sp. gxy201 TaxID=2957200 RepID=UPI003D9FF819